MERITNRPMNGKSEPIVQIQYVEVPAPQVSRPPDAIIQYVDREVIREIPVERIVIQQDTKEADLSPVHKKLKQHEEVADSRHAENNHKFNLVANELNMQSRALVGLKAQRDIDRSRRLMLIKRMKKERDAAQKNELKLKLAIGASLLLSIVSLIVKL